jgi:hypothetical protein
MRLRVSFIVNDVDWGPINGYLLGKEVQNLEVTNATPIKTADGPGRGNGGRTNEGTDLVFEMVKQAGKTGIPAATIVAKYEGTEGAARQTLMRLRDKGLILKGPDDKWRTTAKGNKL